jgi:hypothetical protein
LKRAYSADAARRVSKHVRGDVREADGVVPTCVHGARVVIAKENIKCVLAERDDVHGENLACTRVGRNEDESQEQEGVDMSPPCFRL